MEQEEGSVSIADQATEMSVDDPATETLRKRRKIEEEEGAGGDPMMTEKEDEMEAVAGKSANSSTDDEDYQKEDEDDDASEWDWEPESEEDEDEPWCYEPGSIWQRLTENEQLLSSQRPSSDFRLHSKPSEYTSKLAKALHHLRKIAEERTLAMYDRLLSDPEKSKTLGDFTKKRIDKIKTVRNDDPNFKMCYCSQDLMEFFVKFDLKGSLYSNIMIIRDKETGEIVNVYEDFKSYVCGVAANDVEDEDREELFFKLYNDLLNYMQACDKKRFLTMQSRFEVTNDLFQRVMIIDEDRKLTYVEIIPWVYNLLNVKEREVLADERLNTIKFLWDLRSKGKLSLCKKRVATAYHKLSLIDEQIFKTKERCLFGDYMLVESLSLDKEVNVHEYYFHIFQSRRIFHDEYQYVIEFHPSEEENWAALSEEEKSDSEKWTKKLVEEHEQILRSIRQKWVSFLDYLSLKKKVAQEIGIWRVHVDDYLKKEMHAEDLGASETCIPRDG